MQQRSPTSPTPEPKMDAVSIIAFILGVAWLVGIFVFHLGGWIHILIVVAVIMTMSRMAKNPVR